MTKEKDSVSRERLDRIGRRITNAAVLSKAESDEIVNAPFLFAKIRTRTAGQQLLESSGVWSGFWQISKRAIPAMMILAAVSLGLSSYMTGNKTQPAAFSVDAYLGTNESGIENMMFAERRPLTRDEVLATIITKDEREAVK
jgi:hypothetical protein